MSTYDELAEQVLKLARELDVETCRFDFHFGGVGGVDVTFGYDRDRPDELTLLIGTDFVKRWQGDTQP